MDVVNNGTIKPGQVVNLTIKLDQGNNGTINQAFNNSAIIEKVPDNENKLIIEFLKKLRLHLEEFNNQIEILKDKQGFNDNQFSILQKAQLVVNIVDSYLNKYSLSYERFMNYITSKMNFLRKIIYIIFQLLMSLTQFIEKIVKFF